MNRSIIIIFFLCAAALNYVQGQTKLKDGTVSGSDNLANPDAILELESSNKGLLLPRVALTGTTSASPLSTHIKGMTVYNTAHVSDVDSGMYYNDGTRWVRLANAGPLQAWNITGNAGTHSGTNLVGNAVDGNFWGTTDNQSVIVGVNGIKVAKFDSLQNLTGGTNNVINNGPSAGNSLVWGNNNLDSATNTFVAGSNNRLSQNAGYSSLLGDNNTSSAQYTFGAGSNNIISGNYSMALGQKDTASGVGSFAQGINNKASGRYSVVLGGDDPAVSGWDGGSIASGENSFSVGSGNRSVGRHSHTMGDVNTANGYASFAGGESSITNGDYSFVWGGGGCNAALGAAAFGYGNTAGGYGSLVTGGFNATTTSDALVVGSANIFRDGSPTTQIGTDAVFQIGNSNVDNTIPNYNGYTPVSNAVTILKNGWTEIGTHNTKPTSTLQINGSVSMPIKAVTGNYTLTANDYTIVSRNTGATTLTFPDPATCPGRIYCIINNGTTQITSSVAYEVSTGNTQNYFQVAGIGIGSTNPNFGNKYILQSDGTIWILIQLG